MSAGFKLNKAYFTSICDIKPLHKTHSLQPSEIPNKTINITTNITRTSSISPGEQQSTRNRVLHNPARRCTQYRMSVGHSDAKSVACGGPATRKIIYNDHYRVPHAVNASVCTHSSGRSCSPHGTTLAPLEYNGRRNMHIHGHAVAPAARVVDLRNLI